MSRRACWRCCREGAGMMNNSRKTLTVLIGGIVVVTLLAFLALSGVAATFAWMAGGGYGSGPVLCQAVTPGTSTSTPAMTPHLGGNTSPCVPASQIGARVVAWAQAMANALYVNPACGGRISYPDLLLHLVQGAWHRFPTWRAHFPAGGDPVRRAGLSGLLCLGQRHLPVREFRARGLLPGLSHAADCQRV